jgi:hypothetical protein
METERRISSSSTLSRGSLTARDRRTRHPGEEGTMRRISHLHRTLVVLAVGLFALAAPLVAYADGGPYGG